MYLAQSYRTGTSKTSNCDCGVERETAECYLLHCSIHSQSRNDIFDIADLLKFQEVQKYADYFEFTTFSIV